ncbi:MAG: methyltransferase domain-containing protein [Elusimicrobia bacterium]|nr:methyltransferase domain-containing protein [Elusimicrobiota bacterium]
MRRDDLNFLACPVCGGGLSAEGSDPAIEKALLKCAGCGRDYPVIRGIPRLLPDSLMPVLAAQLKEDFSGFSFSFPLEKRDHRSTIETEDFLAKQRATMSAFAYEWNEFTELSPEFCENEYVRTLAPLPPDIVQGKNVLEAGTGVGFFLDRMQHYGAKRLFGMNLGLDVETAGRRTAHYGNVTAVQGDIFHLPFKPGLDFIISHGVIHHLPEPETGFRSLVKALKAGGEIFIWVYGKDPAVPAIEFLRKAMHRMPKPLANLLSLPCALPLLFAKWAYLSLRAAGLYAAAEKVPYRQYAVRNFREMHCTIMDKLFVPVVNYYDEDDVRPWFDRAGLGGVSISNRDGNSWSCYGVKGSSPEAGAHA